MKTKTLYYAVFAVLIISSVIIFTKDQPASGNKILSKSSEIFEKKHIPYDFLFLVKNYPDEIFDIKAYKKAINEVALNRHLNIGAGRQEVSWQLEGPGNTGGRINEVIVSPNDQDIIYVGNATGGIYKTTNGGASWYPVFDEFPYLAIGEITLEPGNPDVIYAGTGDPNISGYPFIGNGVYKSTDAGETWTHLGLDEQGIVSRIVIDPSNTSTIYTGTMGIPFERDNNRGLYKSTDGGSTWDQVLFISDQAGIIDLLIDPDNPQVLYAAGWDRIRNNHESLVSGPAAKIYKTTDGGANWSILTGGLPTQDKSRIGMCMSALDPDIIFAMYVNPNDMQVDGIYKTTNGGASWSSLSTSGLNQALGGFGWYFAQIRVNPTDNDELFFLGVDLYRTTNGGSSWSMAGPEWYTYEFHADKHDLFYITGTTILCATDGGLYKSTNGGDDWTDIENIPNNQFYRITVDPHNPGYYCGGVQDNGTNRGNAANLNNWQKLYGGDGFQPLYNPDDPNLFYAESQNGALVYYDGSWESFTGGISNQDRRSWDMPVIMSHHDYDVMYTGTYRIYRNTSSPYGNWSAISGDLTEGTDNTFHVITTIEESPLDPDHLYAGASDGYVHRSLNGGNTWEDITGSLPVRYVSCIKASPFATNTVYVSHTGYKDNDFIPHIHKSENNGDTWTDISGNLPQIAINDILIYDQYEDMVIFAATDGGVYYTENAGNTWERIGNNMPVIPVYDIDYDSYNDKLIAGTFARSMMSVRLDSLLTGINDQIAENIMDINIYPTIVSDNINIEVNNSNTTNYIKVYDNTGRLLISEISNNDHIHLNVNNLPSGIYVVVVNNKKSKGIRRFVKQ